jgi:hypothetical protein
VPSRVRLELSCTTARTAGEACSIAHRISAACRKLTSQCSIDHRPKNVLHLVRSYFGVGVGGCCSEACVSRPDNGSQLRRPLSPAQSAAQSPIQRRLRTTEPGSGIIVFLFYSRHATLRCFFEHPDEKLPLDLFRGNWGAEQIPLKVIAAKLM